MNRLPELDFGVNLTTSEKEYISQELPNVFNGIRINIFDCPKPFIIGRHELTQSVAINNKNYLDFTFRISTNTRYTRKSQFIVNFTCEINELKLNFPYYHSSKTGLARLVEHIKIVVAFIQMHSGTTMSYEALARIVMEKLK